MLLDVLLPHRCAACGVPGSAFCAGCHDALIRLAPPLCDRCGSPGAWPVKRCAECSGRRIAFASARAAIVYDEPARRFVQAWKEHGQRRLAREAAAIVAETLSRPAVAAIGFVPADGERALRRGHRPAEALARELGRVWELPVAPLPPAFALGRASARAGAAGAAAERSRCVRPGARVACPSLPGRRHLHERRHRRRRGVRASAGRRTKSGGGDVGARRSLSRGLGPS